MPRYLIVRTFEIDEEAMPDVGRRSKEIAKEEFPEITWEHSHVTVSDNDSFRQFCVYEAPDTETLRSHGKRVGAHRIDHIWVTPPLVGSLTAAQVHRDSRDWEKASDHVPVMIDIG